MNDSNEARKRGRPSTGLTPKRYFRMDDDSWSEIVKAAESQGESASEYIRRVMLRSARTINGKSS